MSQLITQLVVRVQCAAAAGRDEDGQTLVEYALIITAVSIGTMVALGALSGKLNLLFNQIANAL